MSSILRALKKLETEPQHQEESRQPLDSKFVPLADTSPRKTASHVFIMVIGTGLVCGLVILAGWWLLSERVPPSVVAPPRISQPNGLQREIVPGAPQTAGPSEKFAVPAESAIPSADVPVSPPAGVEKPRTSSLKIPPPPPAPIEQKDLVPEGGQAAEPAETSPASQPPADGVSQGPLEKSAVAAVASSKASAKVAPVEIPVLTDSEITLQAISWAPNPQKRIAVINNRILRQRDMVAGYRIDTINQDDVVLSDKGKKWKLVFRIK